MKNYITSIIILILFPMSLISQDLQPYKNTDLTIEQRVNDLLSRMTLQEKVGQMTQLNITVINTTGEQRDVELDADKARNLLQNHHIGSFLNGEAVPPEVWYTYMNDLTRIAFEETRLGIPIIYGIDHIHGASYLEGSTIFPQNINIGATFNPQFSYEAGWVTAYESADLGHHWNFAPVLDLGINPLWPRLWETFGEDPFLAARMGKAYVKGFQGNGDIEPYKVAATAKHFLGYSNPSSGWDRTPVQLSTQKLHEIHRPAFQAAIDAGVKTVMLNSGEINGVPVHASREIVTDLLRNEMGFEGVVVTDWDDIGKLVDFHKTAKNYKEATYQAVNAGIDINMTPLTLDFNHTLIELAEEGRITMDRIDESVRRILKLKFELGLFENPFPRNDRFDRIGSLENKQKALDAARESIVLLKNEGNHLPLQNPKKIILSGPTADNKRNLSGGWTLAWQGAEEERYPEDMHTIFSALKIEFPEAEIELMNGSDINTGKNSQAFSNRLNDADLIIYAGGEEPYTEFVGNITDLSLPMEQQSEINLLSKSNTPLLLILVQGRPRIITDVFQNVEGLLFAGLPGFEGAEAIANVISGKVNPSGKLPISYPQYPNHFVTYNHKSSDIYFFNPEEANDISQGSDNTSLFEFGYGLSYTDFEYRDLTLSTDRISDKETLRVSVKVINTGVREGKESVLWFITNHVGRITRPVKELKHFEKICLKPGEEKTLYFEIEPIKNLSYPDFDGSAILESGTYTIRVGNISREFNLIKSE